MYSSERQYKRPLLYDLSCSVHLEDDGYFADIAFSTQNIFKQSQRAPGSFAVRNSGGTQEVLYQETFQFERYWLPSNVTTTFSCPSCSSDEDIEVIVINQWDDETTEKVKCTIG